MGRRRQTDEIAFGSDSFLDIVANIVGILIILIVIAGVRVAHMPALPPHTAQVETTAAADPPPVLAIAAPAPPTPIAVPPAPSEPIAAPQPISPPPELLARLAELRSNLHRLDQTRNALTLQIESSQQQTRTLQQQLAAAATNSQLEQQQIESGRRTISGLQTELETCQRQIAGLQLELAELEASQPPTQQLRHKLTPLGKVVQGEELFFLLSGNRVAVAPLEGLAEKFNEELMRKRTQLLRGRSRIGTVGPVEGFSLEYLVSLESATLREELQMGTTIIRLGVSELRVLPLPEAVYESADEALLPQSRFLRALRAGGRNATLTFWVYPDSFALHRHLKDFAHDNGFDVASRPVPQGIPIAISPGNGSRSVAQ